MGSYDDLAPDYHWLFDDEQLSGRPFLAAYEPLLDELENGARVLDAACGIGVEAMALARRGLDVVATDSSAAMCDEARRRSAVVGVELDVRQARWGDLPGLGLTPRRLVVCNGNSLVHADGHDGRVAALRAMAAVLDADGRIVIGTRDFEHLRRTRPTQEVAPTAIGRDGWSCVPSYSWSIPERWDEVHVATLHFDLVHDATGERTRRTHHVRFVPFTAAELDRSLTEAGLVTIASDRTGDTARCTIVAAADQRRRRADRGW